MGVEAVGSSLSLDALLPVVKNRLLNANVVLSEAVDGDCNALDFTGVLVLPYLLSMSPSVVFHHTYISEGQLKAMQYYDLTKEYSVKMSVLVGN